MRIVADLRVPRTSPVAPVSTEIQKIAPTELAREGAQIEELNPVLESRGSPYRARITEYHVLEDPESGRGQEAGDEEDGNLLDEEEEEIESSEDLPTRPQRQRLRPAIHERRRRVLQFMNPPALQHPFPPNLRYALSKVLENGSHHDAAYDVGYHLADGVSLELARATVLLCRIKFKSEFPL
jgi:regulator of RNase E activity RraB